MDVYHVKLVVVESHCPEYQVGDEIIFDGPFINKEKSGPLCMTALQAIYPYIFAARQGAIWKPLIQCPDCDETVVFKVVKQ